MTDLERAKAEAYREVLDFLSTMYTPASSLVERFVKERLEELNK